MSNARNLARLLPNASGQLPDAAMASGSVLQVVQGVLRTAVTISGTTFQTVSGLSASITPLSSSSKILVLVSMQTGMDGTNIYSACKLQRNGSDIPEAVSAVGGTPVNATWSPSPSLAGATAGAEYDLYNSNFAFSDAPASTSQQTYSVVLRPMGTTPRTVHINRSGDTGDINRRNGVSTITLMEIAA